MKAGIVEMHRQVGDLVVDKGIAVRGMIIRHLVLPENLAGSDLILPWIAREISPDSYVNIMDQYHPSWHAGNKGDLSLPPYLHRRLLPQEYEFAIHCAIKSGLHRGF
jgi:putative pyruvate formate lyase activating enzyme